MLSLYLFRKSEDLISFYYIAFRLRFNVMRIIYSLAKVWGYPGVKDPLDSREAQGLRVDSKLMSFDVNPCNQSKIYKSKET